MQSNRIRFYYGTDIIGNQVGAALKNVIGLAAGILDGLGWYGLKGALMARAPIEVGRLIEFKGGNAFLPALVGRTRVPIGVINKRIVGRIVFLFSLFGLPALLVIHHLN